MNYYRYMDKVILSNDEYSLGDRISEEEAKGEDGILYYLTNRQPGKFNRSFCLSHSSLFNLLQEDENLLSDAPCYEKESIPQWLIYKIVKNELKWVNMGYTNWEDTLAIRKNDKWKIHIVGLGDVGGILLTGLRLLGGDIISRIGIFDIDSNKVNRWLMEAGQILSPEDNAVYPEIAYVDKDELFNCDMFVFALSIGVPSLDTSQTDVRMAQYEGNSRIIKEYATSARQNRFKGIFAVLSDPVDLLCHKAFVESNTDEKGIMDYKGLGPEQIRGYGLGVMRARAAFHSIDMGFSDGFIKSGRAYGPHGKGLVIANNIENYDDNVSIALTEKTLNSNMAVRKTGFKPYIAPALSSGTLSILATLRGHWHYSAIFLGGVYFGCRNKLNYSGTELERLKIPVKLMERIKESYKSLGEVK